MSPSISRIASRISSQGTGCTQGMPSTGVNSNAAALTLILMFVGRLNDRSGESVCNGVFGGEWESASKKTNFRSSELADSKSRDIYDARTDADDGLWAPSTSTVKVSSGPSVLTLAGHNFDKGTSWNDSLPTQAVERTPVAIVFGVIFFWNGSR